MLSAARMEVRKNFENNRTLAAGSDELTQQVAFAEEVAKFLKENVVQGHLKDGEGNYSMSSSAGANASRRHVPFQLLIPSTRAQYT